MAIGARDATNIAIKVYGIAKLATAAANAKRVRYPPPPPNTAEAIKNERQMPHPLLGGISLEQAQAMRKDFTALGELAHKNLFLLNVSRRSPTTRTADEGPIGLDIFPPEESFYFYALDVSYSPYTVTGEKRRIGTLSADGVNGSEPVEMRLTTYDNKQGVMKSFFKRMAEAAILVEGEGGNRRPNGLVGVPADYTFNVEVIHAYFDNELAELAKAPPYRDKFLMRVGQIDFDLSRREEGFTELQMTFVESDQFM